MFRKASGIPGCRLEGSLQAVATRKQGQSARRSRDGRFARMCEPCRFYRMPPACDALTFVNPIGMVSGLAYSQIKLLLCNYSFFLGIHLLRSSSSMSSTTSGACTGMSAIFAAVGSVRPRRVGITGRSPSKKNACS